MSDVNSHSELEQQAQAILNSELQAARNQEVSDPITAEQVVKKFATALTTRTTAELYLEAAKHDLMNVLTYCLRSTDLTYQNKLGDGALHVAARAGQLNICKHLLHLGLTGNVENRLGETPLFYACDAGHVEVVRLLVKCSDVLHVNVFGQTALHMAAREGNEEACEAMLKTNKRGVNIKDQVGQTAHGYALELGHMKLAQFLERYGGKSA